MTDENSHASVLELLRNRFQCAIAAISGQPADAVDPQLRAAGDPKFGDYQCNAAMSLAKLLRAKPRDVAGKIVEAVDLAGVAEPLEIAGPGFINIRLTAGFLEGWLGGIPPAPPALAARPGDEADGGPEWLADRLGMSPADRPQRVVVDYSSPNIAKQMHVGHLRSTILGDVIARVLMFEGHEVVRQNHVGDWGTAIGMVVTGLWYIASRLARGEDAARVEARLKELTEAEGEGSAGVPPASTLDALGRQICEEWSEDLKREQPGDFAELDVRLEQLELGYRFVQKVCEVAGRQGWTIVTGGGESPRPEPLADVPRKVTVMLQQGGTANEPERRAWRRAREISLRYCQQIYDALGVLLTTDDVCGESFYQLERDRLAEVLDELRGKLLTRVSYRLADDDPLPSDGWVELREDQGAWCLYFYDERGKPRFKAQDGSDLPMIVQKSDGAYLYATTDLAALRYRTQEIVFSSGKAGATRLIYVTDARQRLHFQMLFTAARAAGWVSPEQTQLEHVTFGSVLGENRKPLKTRSGQNVKLMELLEEAERRALELLEQRDTQGSTVDAAWQTGGSPSDHRTTAVAAALGEPDEEVLRMIARRLGVPVESISLDAPLPVDSLDVIDLVMEVEVGFDTERSTETTGELRTFGDLARMLTALRHTRSLGDKAPTTDADAPMPMSPEQRRDLARRIGVAAVKYADLRNDRNSDYVFAWDKLLALQGNTAPYMLYAYARVRSIYRKAADRLGVDASAAADAPLTLVEPAERALALCLVRLREAIDQVAAELTPNVLCGYLYDLAGDFMRFYETCPVLDAPDDATRRSRLRLCDLSARTLKLGLGLLGIEVVERM